MEPVSRRGFIKTTHRRGGRRRSRRGDACGDRRRQHRGRRSTCDATRTPAGAQLNETVVAHLRDLHNGKIAVFAGDREITITDKRLAALLFNATR